MYYVLWDSDKQKVVAGPQTLKPDDTWVPYVHGERLKLTDNLIDYWDEDRLLVTQRCEENTSWMDMRTYEYPSIDKQLEALYDDLKNNRLGTDGDFFNMIKEIKDKFPK